MIEVDVPSLLRGVAVAAVIAVPAALIGLWASDGDDLGWLAGLAVLVVLLGLVIGGAVAAHRQEVGAPLTHGLLTAVLLFVIVQGIGLLRRAIAGDEITWSRIASSAVLSLLAGAVGGALGGRLHSGTRNAG
jgi:putative membrane protein (TIGR04086 family)